MILQQHNNNPFLYFCPNTELMQRSMVFWALNTTVIIEILGPCISGKKTLLELLNYGTFGIAAQDR